MTVSLMAKNNTYSFKNISFLKITEDEKKPFISCEIDLPINEDFNILNKYNDIKIEYENKNIFEGKVDYQKAVFSTDGSFLSIKGSTKIPSILFSNMAKPASYVNITLYQLASIYLYPYGITRIDAVDNRMIPLFKVGLNESYWGVIKRFCEGMYSKTPYIENNTLVLKDKINYKIYNFSNRDKDIKYHKYSTLEVVSKQGEELSSTIVIDENNKEVLYENSNGLYGLNRYISGSSGYNLVARWSGKKELSINIKDSFSIFLSSPYYLDINIKDEVYINDISTEKYEVRYVEKIFGKSIKTNIVLCKKH